MAWLDRSGMNRADRDLMQILALRGKELGRLRVAGRWKRAQRQRMQTAPASVVQPGPQVAGAFRLVSP